MFQDNIYTLHVETQFKNFTIMIGTQVPLWKISFKVINYDYDS